MLVYNWWTEKMWRICGENTLVLRRFLKNRNREPWFLWPKQKGIKEGGIDSFKEPVPFKESVPQKESIPEEEPIP